MNEPNTELIAPTPLQDFMALTPTPSALIRLALEELVKRDEDPRYEVDMSTWHSMNTYYGTKGTCYVCWAGSLIARYEPPSTEVSPSAFSRLPDVIRKRYEALDTFRTGDILGGLKLLNVTTSKHQLQPLWEDTHDDRSFFVHDYEDEPYIWFMDMLCLAEYLDEFDLTIDIKEESDGNGLPNDTSTRRTETCESDSEGV